MQYLGAILKKKKNRIISVCFQGKHFNFTIIKVYATTTNTEKAEVDHIYEDLQHLLELIPKCVLFILGDWNAKIESQVIPE